MEPRGPWRTAGIAVADMPNLFFLLGPNTGLGTHSMVYHDRIADPTMSPQAIAAVDKAGAEALAPTRARRTRYNDELQEKLASSVWNTGGCRSWYLDEHGVNRVAVERHTWQYWLATRELKPSEYRFFGTHHDAAA